MSQSNQYRTYLTSLEWRARRRRILKAWRNRCALFPWMPADHCHHLTYRNLRHEFFWIDCLPLSKFAHDMIHTRITIGGVAIEPFFPKRQPNAFRRRAFNVVWRVWSLVSLILVWVLRV